MKCTKNECPAAATTIPKIWLTDGTRRLGTILGLATCVDHVLPVEQLVDREHWPQWEGIARIAGQFEAVFELTSVEQLDIDSDEAKAFYRMQAKAKADLN